VPAPAPASAPAPAPARARGLEVPCALLLLVVARVVAARVAVARDVVIIDRVVAVSRVGGVGGARGARGALALARALLGDVGRDGRVETREQRRLVARDGEAALLEERLEVVAARRYL